MRAVLLGQDLDLDETPPEHSTILVRRDSGETYQEFPTRPTTRAPSGRIIVSSCYPSAAQMKPFDHGLLVYERVDAVLIADC